MHVYSLLLDAMVDVAHDFFLWNLDFCQMPGCYVEFCPPARADILSIAQTGGVTSDKNKCSVCIIIRGVEIKIKIYLHLLVIMEYIRRIRCIYIKRCHHIRHPEVRSCVGLLVHLWLLGMKVCKPCEKRQPDAGQERDQCAHNNLQSLRGDKSTNLFHKFFRSNNFIVYGNMDNV